MPKRIRTDRPLSPLDDLSVRIRDELKARISLDICDQIFDLFYDQLIEHLNKDEVRWELQEAVRAKFEDELDEGEVLAPPEASRSTDRDDEPAPEAAQ